jgi:hypothetical protein
MDSVLGHHRTGWFAQVSNGFAGFSDAATGGMAGYLRRGLGYDDVIDRSSWAYRGGFVTGEVAGFAATFVSPCGLVTSARWGVRAINAAQGVSGLLSAQEQWQQGNYLAAALDATGSVLNFTQLFKACFTGDVKLLARGSWGEGWRRIDEITTDDEVLSRDEHDLSGPLAWKKVEETFERVGLVLELEVGGRTIGTTAERYEGSAPDGTESGTQAVHQVTAERYREVNSPILSASDSTYPAMSRNMAHSNANMPSWSRRDSNPITKLGIFQHPDP